MKNHKTLLLWLVLSLWILPRSLVFMLFIAYMYTRDSSITETLSTVGSTNLMQNTLPYDDLSIPKEKIEEEDFRTRIRDLYYEDIYRPLEDYFDKKTGYRQFYQTPDVSGFIDAVYRNQPSCKDNSLFCVGYNVHASTQ